MYMIGPNCTIRDSVIRNSIVEDGSQVERLILEDALIGQNAILSGTAQTLIIGDNSKTRVGSQA